MNYNFVNYLYLFKLLLLNQNNQTAVWLIVLGMRNKKKRDFWKNIKMELLVFANELFIYKTLYI